MKNAFILFLVSCSAPLAKVGSVKFQVSNDFPIQMIEEKTKKFNEIMGCTMVELQQSNKKIERALDGVNSISLMSDDDRQTAGEEGRMTRYRLTDEVDVTFHINDQGRIYTWVVYHEYLHVIGVGHTADPCDIMWSPDHPLWMWHSFQCTVNDPDERLKDLKKRLGDFGTQYCAE